MRVGVPDDLLVDGFDFDVGEDQQDHVSEVEGDLVRVAQVVQHRVNDAVSQFVAALLYQFLRSDLPYHKEHVGVHLVRAQVLLVLALVRVLLKPILLNTK